MDFFPRSLISVIEIFSIMSPLLLGDLELRLLCCNACLDIPIPMHALQDFEQPFSGMQPPLGRANPPSGLGHAKISSCCCISLPCTWSSSSCLPRRGARCVFYKCVHRRAPLSPLRYGFCGAREVAFLLFASPPHAVCALVPFS